MEVRVSKQTLRYAILVLGLITGVIHLFLLNILEFNWLMLLNGLGFLVLTGIVFFDPGVLAKQRKRVLYLFIIYTLVTILGFFVMNDAPFGPLGIIAKIDEVLLIIALWLYRHK